MLFFQISIHNQNLLSVRVAFAELLITRLIFKLRGKHLLFWFVEVEKEIGQTCKKKL